MNETPENKYYSRIYELARFQAQVSIAILPIGAAVAGYVAQQKYSGGLLTVLGLVWLGLLGISISIFLNLRVVNIDEPHSPDQRDALRRASNGALTFFVAGALVLIASPIGIVATQIPASRLLDVRLSSASLSMAIDQSVPVDRNIVMTVHNVRRNELENIKTAVLYSNVECVSAVKVNEILPSATNDTWIKVWKVYTTPACRLGDEMIQFNLLQDGQLIGTATLTLRIKSE